ncbi:class I ribonucleotide reductase maintenance protein YfaE [Taylorella asinigenitalis]|uniref:class I ribonucleotide reductase maintenance protein YfaE n=1 Tax=Taylorella asinigenitalis TaxID=84590 RepID=UPI000AEC33DC|nr:class I ribonucleotide reductase maintenance protein YfaE [Taylorella asinigenitalis]
MAYVITESLGFHTYENETLLESLERTGHNVPSHCRSGFCGTCRTKIITGEVDYLIDPLAYIGPDEILPCCCKAKGSVILDCSTDIRD